MIRSIMSKFLTPRSAPGVPQGEWTYRPQVKTFGPYILPADLDASINIWFDDRIVIPNVHFHVLDVYYQATSPTPNVIQHSALVSFLIIEPI